MLLKIPPVDAFCHFREFISEKDIRLGWPLLKAGLLCCRTSIWIWISNGCGWCHIMSFSRRIRRYLTPRCVGSPKSELSFLHPKKHSKTSIHITKVHGSSQHGSFLTRWIHVKIYFFNIVKKNASYHQICKFMIFINLPKAEWIR